MNELMIYEVKLSHNVAEATTKIIAPKVKPKLFVKSQIFCKKFDVDYVPVL